MRLLQSGGQRLQPEVRRQLAETFPNAFVQENFGMSEGTLFFVRRSDPEEVRMETVGTPVSPDDEVRLTDEEGRDVPDGVLSAGRIRVDDRDVPLVLRRRGDEVLALGATCSHAGGPLAEPVEQRRRQQADHREHRGGEGGV